jgi:hypothetical protein
MQAIKINEDSTITSLTFDNENGTLSFLQGEVGGYIEHVPFPVAGVDAWINEEGKMLCEPNFLATVIMKSAGLLFPNDFVAGPMVLTSSDGQGDTIGLTDDQISQVSALLGGGA